MYTTYPCCSALKWLNSRRVIVRLNFEYATKTISYIYQSCIFLPCFYKQFCTVAGKCLKPFNGIFVAAMLAPHNGVHGYFIKIGRTAEYLFYFFKFFFAKTEFGGLL